MPTKTRKPGQRKRKAGRPTKFRKPPELDLTIPRVELPTEINLLVGKQGAFLSAYCLTGNLTQAAKAANVSREMHTYWRNSSPDYVKVYKVAKLIARDYLLAEARRRAVEGVQRVKFWNGVPLKDPYTGQPYVEHVYSDKLLITLLQGEWPEKYGRSSEVEHKHSGTISHEVSAATPTDFDALPLEYRRFLLAVERWKEGGCKGNPPEAPRVVQALEDAPSSPEGDAGVE